MADMHHSGEQKVVLERTEVAQQGFDKAAAAAKKNAREPNPKQVMDIPEVREHFELDAPNIERGTE